MTNSIATKFRQNGYSIVCCDVDKRPIGRTGYGLAKWEQKTFAELKDEDIENHPSYSIKMGKHENEQTIICLDFDIYSENGNNQEIQAFLDEWRLDLGEDGLYNTSTEGNYAVLLNITNSEILMREIAELKQFNNNKMKAFGELEILYGEGTCKVLPQSKTRCKKSKEIRQSKLLSEEAMIMVDDEMECLIDYVKRATASAKEGKKPKKNAKVEEIVKVGEYPYFDSWSDLLMNYMGNPHTNGKYKLDRNAVLKVATALKHNDYEIGLFEDWLGEGNDYLEHTESIWDNVKGNMDMSVLCNLCKEVDELALKAWSNKYREWLSVDLLKKGDVEVSKYLAKIMNMKYYNKRWVYFVEKKGLWIEINDVASHIGRKIQELINKATFKLNKEIKELDDDDVNKQKKQEDLKFYNKEFQKANTSHNNLVKLMKTDCLVDAEWFARLDNMPYKVAFKDGIYDLKKCRFRKKLYAMDYLTKTIPFEYKKADVLKKVAVLKELKKICNWNDTHLDRYLSQYGYMMIGDAQREQVFFNYKGETASNGKSVVPEALSAIMPCYCKAMGSDTFETSNKSQVHKVIATWRGLRIGWVNETDKNAQQDASLLKKVCEGTPLSYKKMYGDQEEMEITFKIIFVGNQELKVKDADGGVSRRWIVNQLDSDFQEHYTEDNYERCEFVKDKSFQQRLINDYKYELLEIIFDYAKMYCDEGKMKDVPIEWIEEKEEALETNREVEDFIKTNFEWEGGHEATKDEVGNELHTLKESKINTDWWITKKDMNAFLKSNKISNSDFRTELKRMKLMKNPIIYNCKKKYLKCEGVWYNIKFKGSGEEECM